MPVSASGFGILFLLKSVTLVAGSLYLKLGNHTFAEEVFRELLERNPENTEYYASLEKALQLHTTEEKLWLLAEYRENYPKALAPARLYLNYASGS